MKECYYYLDSTPTHSYMKALYKYPQSEYPYSWLVHENRNRSRQQPEFELADTGKKRIPVIFDHMPLYIKQIMNMYAPCQETTKKIVNYLIVITFLSLKLTGLFHYDNYVKAH